MSRASLPKLKSHISTSRHIIQELQKELAQHVQQNKVLESENKLLVSEIAQLREVSASLFNPSSSQAESPQDMKSLEDTFEQTLVREEQELAAEIAGGSAGIDDVATLQKNLRDMRSKYEVSCLLNIS